VAATETTSGSALIDLVLQKVRQLKQELGGPVVRDGQPKLPAVIETLVETIASPALPIRQNERSQVGPPPDGPLHAEPSASAARDGNRSPIGSTNLEAVITEAIKKRVPGCESFVGVIVEHTTPKSRFDANWALRGVKFGRVDREKANQAIATIVEGMQREFRLSDD
jgi:hypothetical protein